MVRQRAAGGVVLLGTGTTVAVEHAPQRSPRGRGASKPPQTSISASERPTRVLGLDLAMLHTGWCLLVAGEPAAHGTIDLPERPRVREDLASFLRRRADELARHVAFLVVTHHPELVGYEYPDMARPHYSGGSKGREFVAVQGLSRAEGFLIARWPQIGAGVRLVAVPMTSAKKAATGRPGATKDQVAWGLVTHQGWNLRGWTPDEIDAAAVALAAREAL